MSLIPIIPLPPSDPDDVLHKVPVTRSDGRVVMVTRDEHRKIGRRELELAQIVRSAE